MAAPERIRVASAQYHPERLANLAALEAKLARWVEDAAQGGADLIVFPEYAGMEIAGTCTDAIAADLAHSLDAVAQLRPTIDAHLGRLAANHRIHILGPSGPARRADGSVANCALLHTPDGGCGRQEKMIMTPFERKWGITGGRAAQVFDTRIGRVGILICYDSEFPLLARAMSEAGARLLLVPACTERLSGFNRVRTAALARALENTVAIVLSPTVGDALWSPAIDRNTGSAGVYVAAEAGISDTGVLAEGPLNDARLIFGDIDFGQLERLRTSGEMRNTTDWALQPGAAAGRTVAGLVDLR